MRRIDCRGDTKEMHPILPVDLPLIDEPDEHLVHKGRRLQGVIGPLAPKLAGRNAPELRIDEWQQPVERSPVTAAPIGEQRRDVARRDHRSLSLISWIGPLRIAPGRHTAFFIPLTRYGPPCAISYR